MDIDIAKGDIILGGRFKNKRIVVKTIGTDELGQPTINGRNLLTVRIEKKLPYSKKSSQTREMSKESVLNQIYTDAFNDEIRKASI
jgi:hypothetical protein